MRTPDMNLPKLIRLFEKMAREQRIYAPLQLNNSVILYFHKDEATNEVLLTPFHCSEQGAKQIGDTCLFSDTSFFLPYKNNKRLLFNKSELSKKYLLPTWVEKKQIIGLPLSCLAGPLGLLLYPYTPEVTIQKKIIRAFPLLGSIMLTWLTTELHKELSIEKTIHFKSMDQFVQRFTEIVAYWFSPCHYQIIKFDNNIIHQGGLGSTYGKAEDNFQLNFLTQNVNYVIRFSLPSFLSPSLYKSELIHQVRYYIQRKKKYLRVIENIFHSLSGYWQVLHKLKHSYEEVFTPTLQTTPLRIATTDAPKGTETAYKNAFFNKNGQWKIFFQGEEVFLQARFKQAMEVVRLLLFSPQEHYEPLDLDELLEKAGQTYNKGEKIEIPSKETIIEMRNDAKEHLNGLRKLEALKKKRPFQEQLEYWDYRLTFANILLSYGLRVEYIREWKKAKRKIQDLIIHKDTNFEDLNDHKLYNKKKKKKKLYHELKNPDPTKNRKDSIATGFKKFIKCLAEINPVLHAYLLETIVYKNKGNFKPFSFQPDLNTNPDLDDIEWFTGL